MALRAGCLLLPLIFIISARVIFAAGTPACGDPPDTPCTIVGTDLCSNCVTLTAVPNPEDCTSYYLCKNTAEFVPDPFPCPDGEVFDQTELKCKQDGNCTPTCNEPGGDGTCSYTCAGNTNGVRADLFDCSVYYHCSSTDPEMADRCPVDAPYFDGGKCGVDESACCYCRPYCYADDVEKYVEDPTDCRKYFYCSKADEVPVYEGKCKDGEHFDMHAKQCSSTVPCLTLCRNVVDENGCIEPYTCQELGYFPKCKTQCLREYYHCVDVNDDYATPETCPNDLVFNPDTLTCIKSEACPYTHK